MIRKTGDSWNVLARCSPVVLICRPTHIQLREIHPMGVCNFAGVKASKSLKARQLSTGGLQPI
jgi:hypothetical protein